MKHKFENEYQSSIETILNDLFAEQSMSPGNSDETEEEFSRNDKQVFTIEQFQTIAKRTPLNIIKQVIENIKLSMTLNKDTTQMRGER